MYGDKLAFVLKVCGILGILPFYRGQCRFTRSKIYLCIFFGVTLAFYLANVDYLVLHSGKNKIGAIFLRIVCNTFMLTFMGYTFYNSGCKNYNRIGLFLDSFDQVDKSVLEYFDEKSSTPNFYLRYVTFLIIAGSVSIFRMYIQNANISALFSVILTMWFFNTCFLFFCLLDGILIRLVLINKQSYTLGDDVIYHGNNGLVVYMAMHQKICSLIDKFNEIFEWRMFCTIIYLFVEVLGAVAAMLVLLDHRSLMGVTAVTQTVANIIYLLPVFRKAQELQSEIDSANKRYFEFQQQRPSSTWSTVSLLCCMQTAFLKPRVAAAGFFDVNFALIFTLGNLLANYTVVVLQFRSEKM